MQYVLNSENSQRKTGIYLKLNLGLKAFLVINGLTSWVLSDRGDVVFRNHSTLWTVRRDLLSLLSEFQLMSNISRSFVPSSDAGAHQRVQFPGVRSWRSVSLKDEVWPSDTVTSSLTCIYFCPSSLTPRRNFSLTQILERMTCTWKLQYSSWPVVLRKGIFRE